MKVSVIITSYKYGQYLKKALDSALAQDYPDFEVLVVYRPSGDETEAVLAGYQGIKIIKQAGTGLANASNLGLKNSAGEYVIRLDADDLFYPGILEKEARVLAAEPAIDFVYPDYVYYIKQTGERIRKTLPDFDRDELLGRGDFLSGGTMFRRSLFDRVGFYDESLPTLESYEFILRLMKEGVAGRHLPEPLFEYQIHDESMSDNKELIAATGRQIAAAYGLEYKTGASHPRRIP